MSATVLSRTHSLTSRLIWYSYAAILIGLPFHAFLITWLSSLDGAAAISLLRYWPEILLLGVFALTAWVIVRDQPLRHKLLNDRFFWLLIVFIMIHIEVYLADGAATFPALLALKINVGFLLLYLCLSYLKYRPTTNQILLLMLVPAGIVGLFGSLQLTLLPPNVLQSFGYGPLNGHNPAYYLIENSHTIRILSTLWGPNQLGSYLVLPLTLSLWTILRTQGKIRVLGTIVFFLDLVTLYGSQSRGAWLATAIGLGLVVYLLVSRHYKYLILAGSIIIAGILAILLTQNSLPPKLSLLLLHGVKTDTPAGFVSSNGGHLRALTLGYDRLQGHPWGAGLEAAGRASEGTSQQLYTENFYLQLAVQLGYAGLLVFLAMIGLAGWRLRPSFGHPLAIPLLAVLIGLSVNNLFAHTWSDGATAWLWWGLAGIVTKDSLQSS